MAGFTAAADLRRAGRCRIVAGLAQSRNTKMSQQTTAERELAELLVESLNLEGVEPHAIDPEAPLFNEG